MSASFLIGATLTVLLVAVAFGLALAHVLEMPGKMRVGRDTYLAVQTIYYPGFTIGGGVGEAGGILATFLFLFFTPYGSTQFWLTLAALAGLIAMQAVFWLITQPVNRFWLQSQKLGRMGSEFFSTGVKRSRGSSETQPVDWMYLRDRWELSHVARAVLATFSLIAIVAAVATGS